MDHDRQQQPLQPYCVSTATRLRQPIPSKSSSIVKVQWKLYSGHAELEYSNATKHKILQRHEPNDVMSEIQLEYFSKKWEVLQKKKSSKTDNDISPSWQNIRTH